MASGSTGAPANVPFPASSDQYALVSDLQAMAVTTNGYFSSLKSLVDAKSDSANVYTKSEANSTFVPFTDARLADARTPTKHASTHATGGTDALTPAAIGAVAATDLTESVQDIAGAALRAGAGLAVTYDDSAGTITVAQPDTGWRVITSWDAAGTITGTALPANITPTAGLAGSVMVRRVGSWVSWVLTGCSWTGQSVFLTSYVPAGFHRHLVPVTHEIVYADNTVDRALLNGSSIYIGSAGKKTTGSFGIELTFLTTYPYPTTLPGTPA